MRKIKCYYSLPILGGLELVDCLSKLPEDIRVAMANRYYFIEYDCFHFTLQKFILRFFYNSGFAKYLFFDTEKDRDDFVSYFPPIYVNYDDFIHNKPIAPKESVQPVEIKDYIMATRIMGVTTFYDSNKNQLKTITDILGEIAGYILGHDRDWSIDVQTEFFDAKEIEPFKTVRVCVGGVFVDNFPLPVYPIEKYRKVDVYNLVKDFSAFLRVIEWDFEIAKFEY